MNCGICHEPTELWKKNGIICKGCADKPRHRYYALNRPPGFAAVPDGWCLREIWAPMHEVNDWLQAFGWVEYAEPLPFEKVWRYDLMPAAVIAQGRYSKWYREHMQ